MASLPLSLQSGEQQQRDSREVGQTVFERFEAYDFEHDERFQSGIAAIMAGQQQQQQQQQSGSAIQERLVQAKCFYYSKFVEQIDYAGYRRWHELTGSKHGQNGREAPMDQMVAAMGISDQEQHQRQEQGNEISKMNDVTAASASTSASSIPKSSPMTLTLQEVMDKVAKGEALPGIRQIPLTVHSTSSKATLAPRRKPWERASSSEQAASG